jgi:hypothetical protein
METCFEDKFKSLIWDGIDFNYQKSSDQQRQEHDNKSHPLEEL